MKRKSNRLTKELYQGGYWYFVTVCSYKRRELFQMANADGWCGDTEVAATEITNLLIKVFEDSVTIYPSLHIDHWVIMPNHFHMIICFQEGSTTLGSIMKTIKGVSQQKIVAATSVSPDIQKWIKNQKGNPYKIWQKSYHDRIIRNDQELTILQHYIRDNPILWEQDSLHPKNRN